MTRTDIERGWAVTDMGAIHTDTHEVDAAPILCANCQRRFHRGERFSMGLRGDLDGAGPGHGIGPARPVCRACRPFVTFDELQGIENVSLPNWLVWMIDIWRKR